MDPLSLAYFPGVSRAGESIHRGARAEDLTPVRDDGYVKNTSSREKTELEKLHKARELTAPSVPWNREQQPAQLLEKTADGRITVSNVRWGFKEGAKPSDWEPRFQNATIDPSQVKDVYLAVEPFQPEWIAGHTFLVFEFKNDEGLKAADGSSDRALVLSVEARLKDGQAFNLVDGVKDQFHIIHQLSSWKDVVQKTCKREGHKIMRYPLNLDDAHKQELLKKGIDQACQDRSGEFYHTLKNSCFTNVIHLVNQVLPKGRQLREWLVPHIIFNPAANLPRTASLVMGAKHIITGDPPVITQPDRQLFPEEQVKESRFMKAMRTLSEKPGWRSAMTIAGAVAGAVTGAFVPPPVVGAIIGGILGGKSSQVAADYLQQESHFRTEPAEMYY